MAFLARCPGEGAPHAFRTARRSDANQRANAAMDAFIDRHPRS